MTYATIVAGAIVVAMIAYVASGGADFGSGIWDLFATGPRADDQRRALWDAIAPIWEANHVWLLVALVLLFVAFPLAFSSILTVLHIPLTIMLVGIVLRGSSFAFRSYSAGDDSVERQSAIVFAVSSTATPFMLGVAAGAIASGNIDLPGASPTEIDFVSAWLAPFPLAIGAFTLALCAFLAAVYMTLEVENPVLREDFRRRGLAAAVAVGITAFGSISLARQGAPAIWRGLVVSRWAVPFQLATASIAVATIGALWMRRFRLARLGAIAQTALIIAGWAAAQYPYLLYPDLTIQQAAAAPSVLRPLVIALAAGGTLLAPSFWYLYRVFGK
ncbi:MAG: cytochrome d ubiquinol oxidase subunit II [Bradymonadaceae bacterium]